MVKELEIMPEVLKLPALANQFGRGLSLLGERYPYSLSDIELLQAVMPRVGENQRAVDDFFKNLRIIMEQQGATRLVKPYTLRTFGSHILLPALPEGKQFLLRERQDMVDNIKDPAAGFLAQQLFPVKVSGYQLISSLERDNFNLAHYLLFMHPKAVKVESLVEEGFVKSGTDLENLKDVIDVGIKKAGSPVRLRRDSGALGFKMK